MAVWRGPVGARRRAEAIGPSTPSDLAGSSAPVLIPDYARSHSDETLLVLTRAPQQSSQSAAGRPTELSLSPPSDPTPQPDPPSPRRPALQFLPAAPQYWLEHLDSSLGPTSARLTAGVTAVSPGWH
jgi:hypothetical protein